MNKKISLWLSFVIAAVLCVTTFLATATVFGAAYINNMGSGYEDIGNTSQQNEIFDKLSDIENYVETWYYNNTQTTQPKLFSFSLL